MKITKKRAFYGLIIVISMAAIITSGTLMFRSSDKKNDQAATNITDKAPSNMSEADAIIKKAEAAHVSKQYDDATSLYRQARTHYQQTNDIANLAEIDAILSLLEVEKRNTPEPIKPRIAGER